MTVQELIEQLVRLNTPDLNIADYEGNDISEVHIDWDHEGNQYVQLDIDSRTEMHETKSDER